MGDLNRKVTNKNNPVNNNTTNGLVLTEVESKEDAPIHFVLFWLVVYPLFPFK